MTAATTPPGALLRGGGWLAQDSDLGSVFTPERMSDEHRLIAQTASDFVRAEIMTVVDRLEKKDWELLRRLIGRCGELGLLGVDVATEDGGEELDKVVSMLVSERLTGSASFGATFGAQVNLTILPLSLFGTDQQRKQYLPGLMSGALIGAYCLSEPGAGSDALGGKTRADRQADGSFVLNGEKTWITNGGFADLFVVFAKVDGEHFTAFLVERRFPGVSSGREEHKMGLHGSSTTPVVFQDVKVPAGNVLGEVGKGHKIAFNVLNFARFKLGAICVGSARTVIGEAARYAAQRKQFGQSIASFGAIKHKIGEMVARAYGVESLTYRTAGMIDARISRRSQGATTRAAALAAFEEHAIEASIAKVAGSEMLDFVLDENVQIHGGNGFVRDYPAERYYRDARVNRIFEGTNEINRLLIPGLLARRVAKGEASIGPLKSLSADIASPSEAESSDESVLPPPHVLQRFKKASLIVFGCALETYGEKLAVEQEVLTHAADMLIETYAADSAALRARLAVEGGSSAETLHAAAARVIVNDAAMRLEGSARQALPIMLKGGALRAALSAVERLLKWTPANTAALRRTLADETVGRGAYPF
jgi:alkylation response protein AidB-like acyl-CoA dehydrogenase